MRGQTGDSCACACELRSLSIARSAALLDTKSQMTVGIIRLNHSSGFDDDPPKNISRKQSTAKYSGIGKDVKHITI